MSREPTADSDVVLVTGSSTGFGRLISTTLARRGYTVFASMRDIAGRNRNHAADLDDWWRRENFRLSVIGDAGKIDVVVNNTGIATWG